MIESTAGWTIGLILTYMFYTFGTPFFLLLTLIDGFMSTFSKYHVGLFFSGLLMCLCGFVDFLLVKFSILLFLLIKNFDWLSKKYISGKKCLHAMLKLTRLTGIKTDELDMMEYLDKKSTYVDETIVTIEKKYDQIKNQVIEKIVETTETELYKDTVYLISISDYAISEIVDFTKVNFQLAGEFLHSVPYVKTYLEKGNKYLTVGTDLYSKYDKGDEMASTNLAESMNVGTPLNMNIDMDKLGDLAGLMTNFLDQFGDMGNTTLNVEKTHEYTSNRYFDFPLAIHQNSTHFEPNDKPNIIVTKNPNLDIVENFQTILDDEDDNYNFTKFEKFQDEPNDKTSNVINTQKMMSEVDFMIRSFDTSKLNSEMARIDNLRIDDVQKNNEEKLERNVETHGLVSQDLDRLSPQSELSTSMIFENKLLDDEISEMINKGSSIDNTSLTRAFNTVLEITSKTGTDRNKKITLKKKKHR